MTWKRAAVYWAVFLGFATYYFAVLREAPIPSVPPARAAFLGVPAEQISGLEVRQGSRVVRCRRAGGRWEITEPAGRAVASDLVAALLANLTELPDVEVVAENSSTLGDFGLQPPQSEIVLQRAGGAPLSVRLGARNPAGTAVYAQRTDSPRVFLIGLNVRYYEDLLMESQDTTRARNADE